MTAIFCINYDISMMLMFEKRCTSSCSADTAEPARAGAHHLNVNDLLDDLIRQSDALVGKPVALMTKDDKVRAIRFLSESGALLITKSGDKIAKHFGISKYTLYSYIDANSNNRRKRNMGKIDLSINKEGLSIISRRPRKTTSSSRPSRRCRIPDLIPEKIKEKLTPHRSVGRRPRQPVPHFLAQRGQGDRRPVSRRPRTMWRSPSSCPACPAAFVAMSGKWFPTGCHKVGASFGCLAPRLVTGQFDATYHHAVWPSTGNYCRGGAFNSKLLACDSVAILPQDMSKERFDWLKSIAGQIIATPGCESNVKEIFDKTWELKQDPTMMIFNQFAEMGNPLWHYNVTGYALADLFEAVKKPGQNSPAPASPPAPPARCPPAIC